MAKNVRGNVTRCYDGDTFTFQPDSGADFKVRLIGIDTPEMRGNQPYAREARDKLRELILNKRLMVKTFKDDRYGRKLGSVDIDEGDVSVILVREGLAKIYRKGGAVYGDIYDDLEDAEDAAKNERLGVWSLP